MSTPIVLVTGGTGFIGSHVIHQLLQQDYIVRATARTGKASKIQSMFPDEYASGKLQVVEVESLTADHTEALRGVWAVIHCASPAFVKGETAEEIIDGALNGSLSVFQAAIDAGVKKIVVTGTIATLFGPDFQEAFGTEVVKATSFGAVERKDLTLKDSGMTAYQKAKTVADKLIWEIAHRHPDVDVTVILPPGVLGPFLPNFSLPADRLGLGTLEFAYQLIVGGQAGPNTYPDVILGHLLDVRDTAKAHVLALTAAPLKDGRDKRIIVLSKIFTWSEVARVVKESRPELVSMLPKDGAEAPLQTSAPLDLSLAEEVLGLKEYIPWQKTIIDSIDQLVSWEGLHSSQ